MGQFKVFCMIFGVSVALFHSFLQTSCASTGDKLKEHTVFTLSTVNVTGDGQSSITQLTIATGPDGKYHYVKKENGNVTTGIWNGPLPPTPDTDKIVQNIEASNTKLVSELSKLSTEIDTTIEGYINKAMMF